jgi:hypothetical protein
VDSPHACDRSRLSRWFFLVFSLFVLQGLVFSSDFCSIDVLLDLISCGCLVLGLIQDLC